MVDSTSPSSGEKASYYSAVCLETWSGWTGGEPTPEPRCLPGVRQHSGPLIVIKRRRSGEAVEYLRTPGLGHAADEPGYSPDFNDEAIWGWAREEATGNLCLGTKALVQQRVGNSLCGLSIRKDEVKGRCRTVLQSKAEGFLENPSPITDTSHLGFGLATTVYLAG